MSEPTRTGRRHATGTAALTWGIVLLAFSVVGSPIGASVLLVGLVAPGQQSTVDVIVALVVVAVLVIAGVFLLRLGLRQRRRARLEKVVDRSAPATMPPALGPSAPIRAVVVDDPVALWRSAFSLDAWWFVDRGAAGASRPFAVVDAGTPTLLAFTSPERARDAARARGLDAAAADRLVWRSPADFVGDIAVYTRAGLQLVALDPDQHGPAGTLAALPEIARLVRR